MQLQSLSLSSGGCLYEEPAPFSRALNSNHFIHVVWCVYGELVGVGYEEPWAGRPCEQKTA